MNAIEVHNTREREFERDKVVCKMMIEAFKVRGQTFHSLPTQNLSLAA